MKQHKDKILLVDDIMADIKFLQAILSNDYQISYELSGKDALHHVKNDPPDLILLDILMPEMDGYEVCKQLKDDPALKGIPIIFTTVMGDEENETKGLALGAVDYITKPFSLPIVKARVDTHLLMKRQRDILEELSTLDGLTGINNRRSFDRYLATEWNRQARSREPLSLIMIDIDFFKNFNDVYGHIAGDECLNKIAGVIDQSASRSADFVARYGGEEFVVVLPKTESTGAANVARKIEEQIDLLQVAHSHSEVADHVTVSQGIATFSSVTKHSQTLLVERADQALYQAKKEGRNRIVISSQLASHP